MNTLKPCSYCGNTSFHYLPNMIADSAHMKTMLGITAKVHTSGEWWMFSLVGCTQCGNTMIFTTNFQEMSKRIAGAQIVQATTSG